MSIFFNPISLDCHVFPPFFLSETVEEAFFLEQLRRLGIHARTESAIVPIVIGNSARALAAAKRLREEGIFVSPIRYPSVPENSARLRLTIMASHKESELVFCAEALARTVFDGSAR